MVPLHFMASCNFHVIAESTQVWSNVIYQFQKSVWVSVIEEDFERESLHASSLLNTEVANFVTRLVNGNGGWCVAFIGVTDIVESNSSSCNEPSQSRYYTVLERSKVTHWDFGNEIIYIKYCSFLGLMGTERLIVTVLALSNINNQYLRIY